MLMQRKIYTTQPICVDKNIIENILLEEKRLNFTEEMENKISELFDLNSNPHAHLS
jgi:hypothetical protein